MSTIANVGHDVFVSSRSTCIQKRDDFDAVIHIYRDDHTEYSCPAASMSRRQNDTRNLFVECREGESLPKELIDRVAMFARTPGKLLVHCFAGRTRSPTIAVIAKMARGTEVMDAIRDIILANWRQRKVASEIAGDPLGDILAWADHLEAIRTATREMFGSKADADAKDVRTAMLESFGPAAGAHSDDEGNPA